MAATIALQSAVHHFGRLDGAATVDWSRRAVDLAGPESPVGRRARTYLAHGLAYSGRTAEAFAALAGAEGDVTDPEVAWLQPRSARGLLRMVDDDLDGARADFHAVATRAYELGVLNIAAFAFAYLARAEYLAGAWDDAVVHAERAVAVNDESDWGFTWPTVVGIAVLVPAARGEWAAAEAAVAGAAGRYPGGYERSVVALAMSRARVAEARGDAADLVAALAPVRSFPIRDAVDEPGFWAWQDLCAEGLVGLGRVEEADALLRPTRSGPPSAAGCRRSRASRGPAGGSRPRRAGPIAPRRPSSGPSTRPARAAAVRAGQDRARGRRFPAPRAAGAGAAELLTSAAAAFERLGAAPYAARCHVELAGSGLHPTRATAAARRSPRRSWWWRGWRRSAGRTGRSPASWWSASRRSSSTCATPSRSSESPGAGSWRRDSGGSRPEADHALSGVT